jgi:hypothetical protein
MKAAALAFGLLTGLVSSATAADEQPYANDFPTSARADYVFACMAVNGQTREALDKCSCSVDVIASLMPYAAYEEAETVMSVRQQGGQTGALMNSVPQFKEAIARLKRAQVEGELRCF